LLKNIYIFICFIYNKIYITKLEAAASRMRAIAHPMRIAIIELLDTNEKMNVTEIYEKLNIEQACASHHLNILKNKGLLNSKRDGKNTIYSIKMTALSKIIDCINNCTL
jgi:DNA-binding transcriptional ArsR family regulator